MKTTSSFVSSRPLPRHVAVIGAAGGLGQGILSVCRAENIAFASLRWTLVRAAVNSRGKDERPVASAEWDGALNSWWLVSYQAMGRWMLEEAAANEFVRAAPVVARRRK